MTLVLIDRCCFKLSVFQGQAWQNFCNDIVIYAVYRLGLHGKPLPVHLEGPNPAIVETPTPAASAAAAASIANLCPICNVNEATPAAAGGNRAMCRTCFDRLDSEGAFGEGFLGAFAAVVINAYASARGPPPPPPSAATAPDSDSDDA